MLSYTTSLRDASIVTGPVMIKYEKNALATVQASSFTPKNIALLYGLLLGTRAVTYQVALTSWSAALPRAQGNACMHSWPPARLLSSE